MRIRWRRRLKSQVAVLGTYRVRVTRRGRRLVGVELWTPVTDDGAYGYLLWKDDE